jgi:putative transcriptional regulator
MNRLKEIREKHNMTQTELAYKAGVTQRYIAFLEKGERMPSLEIACKIAKTLKSSVERIFLPKKCTNSTSKVTA